MKEYKTPVIEEVNENNAISDVFESWGYCKAYVDRALAELSQYRLTGMTPGEIAEMRRDVSKMHGGWIPVEERLPEEPKENPVFDDEPLDLYLVDMGGSYPLRAFWNGKGFTDGWSVLEVIAWRPLPEPYRPERSGK